MWYQKLKVSCMVVFRDEESFEPTKLVILQPFFLFNRGHILWNVHIAVMCVIKHSGTQVV